MKNKECKLCKYKDIYHIDLYDTIVDNCRECQLCSLSLAEYYDLVVNILVHYKIGNINRLSDIDNLKFSEKRKINSFLAYFAIDLARLEETDKICRACESNLHELYLVGGTHVYICKECMKIFFYLDDFQNHINFILKTYNSYFKYIKRFLQLFKRSKNNAEK